MTWWETIQLRHATETLTWSDFKTEFENQFYSRYHHKVKEQEFLVLRQGDISVLEYERRFHDLSLFATQCADIGIYDWEIERWFATGFWDKDWLPYDLNPWGSWLRLHKLWRPVLDKVNRDIMVYGKRDRDYFSGRPPLSKKGKSGVFEQYKKYRSLMVPPH